MAQSRDTNRPSEESGRPGSDLDDLCRRLRDQVLFRSPDPSDIELNDLIRAIRHHLWFITRHRTGGNLDHADRDDLIQEVLIRFLDQCSRSEIRSPAGLLLRMVRHGVIDHWRQRTGKNRATCFSDLGDHEDILLPDYRLPEAESLRRAQAGEARRLRLRRAFARIPKRDRVLLKIRAYRNLTHRQTARKLGRPPGTISRMACEARRRARTILGELFTHRPDADDPLDNPPHSDKI